MEWTESLNVDKIDDTKYSLRHSLGDDPSSDDGVSDLVQSIARHGLLQPVGVVPKDKPDSRGRIYDLVFGHRRLAAHRLLGLAAIRAHVLMRPSDAVVLDIALSENDRRRQLTPVERAEAEARLKKAYESEGKIAHKEGGREGGGVKNRGKKSYGELREQETGGTATARTFENLVALGNAPRITKDAVDERLVSVAGGYTLARFDEQTQEATVHKLRDLGHRDANPKTVHDAAAIAAKELGLRSVHRGTDFIVTEERQQTIDLIEKLKAENEYLRAFIAGVAGRTVADDNKSSLAAIVRAARSLLSGLEV